MWGLFEIKAFFNRETIDQHQQTFPKYSYTTIYFADYCSWLLFFIGTQAFYRLSFSYAGCKYKLEPLPKKSQMKTFLKSRGDLKPCWKTCSRAQTRPYSPQRRRVRLPLCGEQKYMHAFRAHFKLPQNCWLFSWKCQFNGSAIPLKCQITFQISCRNRQWKGSLLHSFLCGHI